MNLALRGGGEAEFPINESNPINKLVDEGKKAAKAASITKTWKGALFCLYF